MLVYMCQGWQKWLGVSSKAECHKVYKVTPSSNAGIRISHGTCPQCAEIALRLAENERLETNCATIRPGDPGRKSSLAG